jgi:hypothetical protein
MRRDEALTLGILALNTLRHPDATSNANFDRMDGAEGEEALETLVRMRDELTTARALILGGEEE